VRAYLERNAERALGSEEAARVSTQVMSVAEDRGEANEGPEQQSAKLSGWIQRLEALPEKLKLRELKALLEKLDPDDEWVRQLKARVDGVLEPGEARPGGV
jgi:hypothetical protein